MRRTTCNHHTIEDILYKVDLTMRRTTCTAGQQTPTRRRQIKAGNRANQSSISQKWQLRYTAEPNFDSRTKKIRGQDLTPQQRHSDTTVRL